MPLISVEIPSRCAALSGRSVWLYITSPDWPVQTQTASSQVCPSWVVWEWQTPRGIPGKPDFSRRASSARVSRIFMESGRYFCQTVYSLKEKQLICFQHSLHQCQTMLVCERLWWGAWTRQNFHSSFMSDGDGRFFYTFLMNLYKSSL